MKRWRSGVSPGRVRAVVALACVGLVVAVGVPLGWWFTHRPSGVRTIGAGVAQSLAAAPASVPTARESPRPPLGTPASSSAPAVASQRTGSAPPAATAPAATPNLLSIPSLDVRASVLAVGVDADGQMALPENVSQVGWYRWSAAPGSAAGSVVVAGHVDSAVQGEGALFELRSVQAGATIQLRSASGATWTYRVVARQEYAKTVLPVAQIFARTGSPRLTLVTCGGVFDRALRSYESNVVVTAVPL